MRHGERLRILTIALLVQGIGLVTPGSVWAQDTKPPPDPWPLPTVAEDAPARPVLATVGAVVGSILYIPFKALGICPGMALAAGVHYAATVGQDAAVDEYLVRAGCTGTYFITPGMVRGQEEFQGSGAP
jgi:hypothetical protein